MNIRFAVLAAASTLCLAAAGPLQAKIVHFSAPLSGSAEVPAHEGSGTGTLKAELNTATKAFTYTITYSGLTGPAVAAHFHGPAAAGANAPPIITIKALASPIKGTEALTAAQMADLQAGKWYFNIHTSAHPGGEIRAQLVP